MIKRLFVCDSGGIARQIFSSGTVVVSDPINVSHTVSGQLTSSGVVFKSNGRLMEYANGAESLINAGQWWSEEPDTAAGNNWRVRCASISSGAWDFAAAATETWVRMDVDRIWRVSATLMNNFSACTAEFEISPYPSGAVVEQFTVSAQASN